MIIPLLMTGYMYTIQRSMIVILYDYLSFLFPLETGRSDPISPSPTIPTAISSNFHEATSQARLKTVNEIRMLMSSYMLGCRCGAGKRASMT